MRKKSFSYRMGQASKKLLKVRQSLDEVNKVLGKWEQKRETKE